jgi:hypothetical protein
VVVRLRGPASPKAIARLFVDFAKIHHPAWPNPARKAVYRAHLELLFFSTDGGRSDLLVFNKLAEAVRALGATAADCREVLFFAGELWGRFAAPATLDWGRSRWSSWSRGRVRP